MDPASDNEHTSLMSGSAMQQGGGEKQKPDWSRFGLSTEQQKATETQRYADYEEPDHGYHDSSPNKNELFHEEQNLSQKPWYKANFFIREPVLFGTWDGVFTSCMINIFGVVIFLRTGWMVGNAGIGYSILIILLTISTALISALSAIGVCERCKMESGGVYFLLSHILGARLGASIGVVYCFGQAVACSLYVMGFGESISALMHQDNEWVARGIAVGVVLLLLGINVAGVKWVIRLQLVLLMVLFVAVMDFLVGSFVHTDPEHGVIGYSSINLANNTGPDYKNGESFFTVFGVFFPTATGIFAGINMSGDLYNPKQNIPVGTLSAVSVSTFLYMAFVLVLGATCVRDVLQTDYMIAEKVSVVGVLWLGGLYISSISSCMGGLYGSPRILQSIANENVMPIFKFLGQGVSYLHVWLAGLYVSSLSASLGSLLGSPRVLQGIAKAGVIPGIKFLGHGRGPNKVPVFALIVITMISIIFIFIGNVNTLGPIVTMPFMLTYGAVDYCYFALAMSFDKQKTRNQKFRDAKKLLNGSQKAEESGKKPVQNGSAGPAGYGATDSAHDSDANKKTTTDTIEKLNSDLDNLFPERVPHDQRHLHKSVSPTTPPPATVKKTVDFEKGLVTPGSEGGESKHEDDTTHLLEENKKAGPVKPNTEIIKQPRSCYSIFCNRWLSLFGSVICIVIMFGIQWGYALACILIAAVVYVYIGQANPGVFPGIADFSLWEWIRDGVKNCCRRGPPPPEQIVVTPNTPAMSTMAAQLTEDNDDFAERGRYHQSEVVKGENFDDYQDYEENEKTAFTRR